jgi:hypothetical protein
MVDDFPILKDEGQTHLFADDIESHVHAEGGIEAERKITPYLEKIRTWSKKWRVNFSAEKSLLVNFTRQRRKQVKPLLFLAGTRIPEANEVKHLGIYFDSGLRWKKQTEESINKAIKLRNLFKILTCTNNGPSIDSLCIMYKALIRSRIEYGIIPYGCSNQNQQKRIETIQNSILRMILGAPASTPIKELQCELGLNSIESRRTWLAGRYVIRVDKQPQHPLYKICQEMRRTPKSWKDHNMPSLKTVIAHTYHTYTKSSTPFEARRFQSHFSSLLA